MKKLNIILSTLFLFLVIGCSNTQTPEHFSRDIKIKTPSTSVLIGNDFTLTVETSDNSALNPLKWNINNNYVSIVETTSASITLKALSYGKTTVMVSEESTNKKAEIIINIDYPSIPNDFDPYEDQPIGFDKEPLLNKNHLLNIVRNYGYHGGELRDNPKPNIDFDDFNHRLSLSPSSNKTFKLSLVDTKNKTPINHTEVQWFIVQNYPYDAIYDLSECTSSYCPLTIEVSNNDISIKANKTPYYDTTYQTYGDIIAVVDGTYIHRKPYYVLNSKEEEKNKTNDEINKVVRSMVTPLMPLTDLEKALFLQETVCQHLTYDMNYLRRPSYENLFLKGRAVCEGYARMFYRLGRELGMIVRNDVDAFDAEHAWNRIWIDDGFYYIDTTWDDEPSADNGYILSFFLRPVVEFEETHPRVGLAEKEGHFGTKHLNTDGNKEKYEQMKKNGKPSFSSSEISKSVDLSKIDFIGDGVNTGYIITSDTDLEYTTGYDGIWHKIIPNQKNYVTHITLKDDGYYDPLDNLPYFILVRRCEENKKSSQYEKINIWSKYNGPNWIKVDNNQTVHNINTKMEYSTNPSSDFKSVDANSMKLDKGEYYFRIKGTKNNLASETVTVIVE